VNQKWNEEEVKAYLGFLANIKGYIGTYVYSLQVHYYEQYTAAI
jgi:hypothetical protein